MSEKTLSSKKLRRIQRKQQMEDKNRANTTKSEIKMPKEWQKPPKHLKGREIGLWHRDRKLFLKLLEKNSESFETEKKVSRKEIKSQKKQKRKEETDLQQQCYRIDLDLTRQQKIEEYLSTARESPPSFLLPQHEYHKRIKKKSFKPSKAKSVVESKGSEQLDSSEASLTIDDCLTKSKVLYDNFPIDFTEEMPVSLMKQFLENGEISGTDSKQSYRSDIPYSSSSRYYRDEENVTEQDDGILASMDKYKHLEETPFKQSFMDILSQNIHSKLEKAVRHNVVLQRNKNIDRELRNAFVQKENILRYRKMRDNRMKLPAFKMQREILQLVNDNQVSLISGETGCGKTTQVAQFILDEALLKLNGSVCNIICTQPRRISAISVAQRVADERAENIGKESVGYQIRLEKKIGRSRGAILFCTTGILLQHMQSDPALKKYSHIILDEIHERDIMCDFVLTLLRDVVAKRSDLKIILMSATLNAEQFSAYFHNCPSISIPGYTYPVEECYLEDVLQITNFKFTKNFKKKNRDFEEDVSFKTHILPYAAHLKEIKMYPDFVIEGLMNSDSEKVNADLIVCLVQYICTHQEPGAILIFVPGWEDINAIMKKLNGDRDSSPKLLIIPLHSMLPTAAQQSVFDRPPHGIRKIVVATNIAETSITIDDIVYVIDCGKTKIKNYDVVNNISTLKPEFVSLANARQRRGRAGRVQSGVCYHLFSRAREKILADYPLPEMLRTRLEEVILNIKLLQLGKAGPFLSKVMDPPNAKTVSLAVELLRQLNALDENENLTPLGFHLAKLPLDPQIGKMLLMGVTMSCLNPILSIAATLSYKDPFFLPLGEEKILKERKLELDNGRKSDHLIMAEVLDRWEDVEKRPSKGSVGKFCEKYYLTRSTLYLLRDLKSQFAQYLCEMGFLKNTNYKHESVNMNSGNQALLKAVICSGLYPNVAILKRKINCKARGMVLLRTSEDGNVTLHQKSVNTAQQQDFESIFFVYHEKLRSSCIFIFETTMVSPLPLLFFCYDFHLTQSGGDKAIIQLNKDLRFSCDKKTAHLIVELKLRLSWLLEYKLSHPGNISWNDQSCDIQLLKTLTELFTTEDDGIMRTAKFDSSE